MFEQYIDEIKGKSFIIAFIITAILGCVIYSYHFQPIYTADDEVMIFGGNVETFFSDWGYWLKQDPRAIGWFIATLFTDGTNGKNLVLFINLLGCSFFSLFFVRFGFGVKSIFWSVMLAAPFFINAMLREQMTYAICLIRFMPMMFIINLTLPVLLKNKLKHILCIALVLLITFWTYQTSVVYYVASVIMLCFVEVIKNQQSDLKTIIVNIVTEKIIPAILVLLLTTSLYFIIHKLTLTANGPLIEQATRYKFDLVSLSTALTRLKQTMYYMIYNIYPATLHNGRMIFMLLFVTAIASIFVIFKSQPIKKQMILSISLICLFLVMLFIINVGIEFTRLPLSMLYISYDISVVVLCMYLIHTALQNVKSLRKIYTALLVVFVMQMGNQTVYKSYKQLTANTAKKMMLNRLVNDVIDFMHDNNINQKTPVYILGFRSDRFNDLIVTKPSSYYLHDDYSSKSYVNQMVRFFPRYLMMLGAKNIITEVDYNKVTSKVLFKNCRKVQGDRTMHRWPFKNSMKYLDGVIYIKVQDTYQDRNFCPHLRYVTKFDHAISPNYIKLRDGYYNLTR